MVKTKFWKDRKVLITGQTGFKGAWLTYYLLKQKADITGIALPPVSEQDLYNKLSIKDQINNYFIDIKDLTEIKNIISRHRPEVVFHLAAQPMVIEGYKNPLNTFETNVNGTINLLEVCRITPEVKSICVITTDKVYRNNLTEHTLGFSEDDPLGGVDPYSASKSAADIVSSSYFESFLKPNNVALTNVRAGNVIGGGDWGENRLVPDLMKALITEEAIELRNPSHTRPWQHVLETVLGYCSIAEQQYYDPNLSGSYNIGPDCIDIKTVREVVGLFSKYFKTLIVRDGLQLAKYNESELLNLQNSKAKKSFGITPALSFDETIELTAVWYDLFNKGSSARSLCDADIDYFERKLSAI